MTGWIAQQEVIVFCLFCIIFTAPRSDSRCCPITTKTSARISVDSSHIIQRKADPLFDAPASFAIPPWAGYCSYPASTTRLYLGTPYINCPWFQSVLPNEFNFTPVSSSIASLNQSNKQNSCSFVVYRIWKFLSVLSLALMPSIFMAVPSFDTRATNLVTIVDVTVTLRLFMWHFEAGSHKIKDCIADSVKITECFAFGQSGATNKQVTRGNEGILRSPQGSHYLGSQNPHVYLFNLPEFNNCCDSYLSKCDSYIAFPLPPEWKKIDCSCLPAKWFSD